MALKALQCPVAILNGATGRILACNAAWSARLDRMAGEAAGPARTLAGTFAGAPSDPGAALRAGQATMRNARLIGAPRDRGASWWDVDLAAYPTVPGAILATAHEVSEHVLAQREADGAREALEETRTRLHLAQDAAGIGTWECRPDTAIQAWSPQQFRLYGLDPAADRPPTIAEWLDFVHPDDRDRVRTHMANAERQSLHKEFRIRRRDDGQTRWLLSLGRVVERGEDGRPSRLIGVNLDITERRAEQDALRESEARLRLACRAAGVFAWDWDVRSGKVIWDEGLEAALGLPRGGFDSSLDAFVALVHAEDLPMVQRALRRALDGETDEYSAEFRMHRADGKLRWTATRAVVLRDAAGQPVRLVGMDHDITDRKIAEGGGPGADPARREGLVEQLAQRTRALTEAAQTLAAEIRKREELQTALLQSQKLEALGELTAGIAHDFNNILSAIFGCFDLIVRHTAEPRVVALAGRGRKAAERADRLTRQLLGFVRHGPLAPAVVEVGVALREVDELASHAINAGIERRIELDDDLWPVLADAHQLEVALLNLVVNARDAMKDGGTLTLAGRNLAAEDRPERLPAGHYVGIAVRDTGEGMPPEVLARATEPFFTTKPQGKGTGLGLAMVQRFAMDSGGTLRIRSTAGLGSEVEIVLPRAALRAMSPPPEPAGMTTDGSARGGAIMVVEDDPHVRAIVAGYLRELGYSVTEAADAEAASVLLHTIPPPDLLLTDMALPGADGLALARRLRAERAELPVLFMTGSAGRAALAGEAVLGKPFSGSELAAAVRRLLGRETAEDGGGLLRRLRSASLREAYLAWQAARGAARLPRLAALDIATLPQADSSFTVAVEQAAGGLGFRYLTVGIALSARFGGTVPDPAEADDDEAIGGLATAYRRCARTGTPAYQYAHYDFGDGAPVAFERLLLPMSEDGATVTHLVGYSLFGDGSTTAGNEAPRPG